MNIPILNPEHRWGCPSCGGMHVTHEARPHVPMHPCPALNGLTAPFAEITGTELDLRTVRHRAVDREDYVGNELVQTDNTGRPVMAVVTERSDGSNDTTVYAPTAR